MFDNPQLAAHRWSHDSILPPVWLWLWTAMLSLAWLVPNHFKPWTAFHADAWMACVALTGALAVVWRARSPIAWFGWPCLILALSLLPWLQYLGGLLPFAGQAWITSLYLLGLMLAMLTAAQWERTSPGQLESALWLAIGLAGVASVGLQLYTWLSLGSSELTDIWSMGLVGDRPYANLGQPNNLATLLLWGLLACLWASLRGVLGTASTMALAIFLLIGLALTQSRTGTLALTLVLLALWLWRSLWPSRRLPWVATGIYLLYWTLPFLLRWIYKYLLLGSDTQLLRIQLHDEQRLDVWRLFLQASLEHPWVGYGWSDVRAAQVAVARQFPSLGITFAQSHNLFLDLVLWAGWPCALLLSAWLLRWTYQRWRTIRLAGDAVLFMLLGVVGLHAMLELPLHYAYFLIPVGMAIGMLDVRLGACELWHGPRHSLVGLWLIATLLLCLVVRDYLRAEESYTALRFEQAHIGTHQPDAASQPDVLLLTQLRAMIQASRIEIKTGMTTAELENLKNVTSRYPSRESSYRMAKAYALNGRPQSARDWLAIGCRLITSEECLQLQRQWRRETPMQHGMTAVVLPEAVSSSAAVLP